jgi:hypothetical protein
MDCVGQQSPLGIDGLELQVIAHPEHGPGPPHSSQKLYRLFSRR